MNIPTAILKSFSPPEAYAEAAFNWKWRALAYFFTLCFICTVATTALAYGAVDDFFDNYFEPAKSQMGKVEITADGVKTPDGKPMMLKSKSGKTFAIATSGKLQADEVKGLLFSVENDRITFYAAGMPEQQIPLAVIVPQQKKINLLQIFPSQATAKWIILPCVFFAASILMNLTYTLSMGLAAKTLAIGAMPSLSFLQCTKIAMVAITPPTLIDLFLMGLLGVPMPGIIFAIIAAVLIWLSIKAMAKNTSKKLA